MLRDIILWPFRQLAGTVRNVWEFITVELSLRELLLPAVYDSIVWISNQVPQALGGGSRSEMITSSFVLAVASFVTGIVTGGLAWLLVGVWTVTGLIGVARFVPAIESNWPIPRFSFGDSNSLGVL